MIRIAVALIAAAATASIVVGFASPAAADTDPRFPVVSLQPGPGQTEAIESYVSDMWVCGPTPGIDQRFTLDVAIEQSFGGVVYTVAHDRYVKDNVSAATVPPGSQCGVLSDPPPPEYPLPSDFAPLLTLNNEPATMPGPTPHAAQASTPTAAVSKAPPTVRPSSSAEAPAPAPVAAPAPVTVAAWTAPVWPWLRVLHEVF